MFEKLISIRVMFFIAKLLILLPTQYGFGPESSTEFANLNIVSFCDKNLNDKLLIRLINYDWLEKRF